MSKFKILIVEDDNWYSNILRYKLSLDPEFEVKVVESGAELINSISTFMPSMITLDYTLPDYKADKLIDIIKKEDFDIPIVVISGQEDMKTALNLLKKGAYEYIIKDDETIDRIWNVSHNIKENHGLKQEIKVLKKKLNNKFDIKKNLIGNSVAMQKISGLIHKASSSRINVCIRGESGTGKEVVAKSIHFNSEAHNKPFIAINVSAIPENLIESELFGYEKGAFTGADKANPGKFEAAGEGTIFLDEIGEMSLAMQAKLLRVIQEREVTRIGSHKKLKIKCRILTATHKDLISEISKGNFREDLYYRIIGLPIVLPPLRDRKEDIPLLCKKFINESCEYNGLDSIELSQEALDKLIKYNFKGNIRELKAIIDLSTILCKNNIITSEDIQLNEARNIDNLTSQNLSLKEMNNKIIYHFLNKHNNNVLKVAQLLDVGKSTIYRLLKEEKQ